MDTFIDDVESPGQMAFGPDGHLYVISNSRKVLRYDGQTGAFLDTFVENPRNDHLRDMAFVPSEAPEPSSAVLVGLAAVGVVGCWVRRRARQHTSVVQ